MDELKRYVYGLFRKYPKTGEIEELKAEIIGNLEARKEDLMSDGLSERQAIDQAKNSILDVDELIDSNKKINLSGFKTEAFQMSLLYLLIAWLVTIPGTFFPAMMRMNIFFLFGLVLMGILYLTGYHQMKRKEPHIISIDVRRYVRIKRIVWFGWSFFLACSFIWITGIHFASNIWFSRPIEIDGPYQFAVIVSDYLAPVLTVVIPISLERLQVLFKKYEVGVSYES